MFARNVFVALAVSMITALSVLATPREAADLFVRDYNAPTHVSARSVDMEARSIDAIHNLLRRQRYEEMLARQEGLSTIIERDQIGAASSLSPYTILPAIVVPLAVLAGTVLF